MKLKTPLHFPCQLKKIASTTTLGTHQSIPPVTQGLKFKPTGHDLEEYMASKENILELSTIISRNWSTTIVEDGSYIRIYPDLETICCCFQGFSFQTVCYDQRVDLNILLVDEVSGIDMQPLIHQLRFYSGS
jgi:hypothetical protein